MERPPSLQMLEDSGKNAEDTQKAVLHQDPVPMELVWVDTRGPLRLQTTHVLPAATGAMHGGVAGAQLGPRDSPTSRPGPAAPQGRLGKGTLRAITWSARQ